MTPDDPNQWQSDQLLLIQKFFDDRVSVRKRENLVLNDNVLSLSGCGSAIQTDLPQWVLPTTQLPPGDSEEHRPADEAGAPARAGRAEQA